VLKAGVLPAPLHVFAGLMGLSSISLKDKVMLSRVGTELLWSAPWKEYALGEMTVEHWLVGLGQSEQARKHLWDIIAVGTLNDHPGNVSALPFYRVLRAAFFGARSNASLLVPHAGLSDILVHPAQRYLEQRGSSLLLGTAIDSLTRTPQGITGASIHSGETMKAPCIVLAVPQYAAVDLLPDKAMAEPISRLEASPIITINLWFDRPIMTEPFAALLNGRIQWVFNRSMLVGSRQKGQYVSCVISGARFHVEREKQELIDQAIEDLSSVYPAAASAVLRHALVVKEVRATFTPRPGTEAFRPSTETSIPNLFFAGDWTNTGIPATIEGAVVSGHRAAGAALRFLER
jgi:squalene-associated FAD-dependent desaturase